MDISRREIASQLVDAISIAALRKTVKSNSFWRNISRGFRENSLQLADFHRATPLFANNGALFVSLCQLYLDEVEAPRKLTLSQRFAWAAERESVPDGLRDVCRTLAQVDLSEIPKIRTQPLHPDDEHLRNEQRSGFTIDSRIEAEEQVPDATDRSSEAGRASPFEGVELDLQVRDADPTPEQPLRDQPASPDDKVNAVPSDVPLWLQEPVMLDWTPPPDHITPAQECVTLFERALVTFAKRQLAARHGDDWLEIACGAYLKKWRNLAERDGATPTQTDFGQVTLGDLKSIICDENNWPAFAPYFPDKSAFEKSMTVLGVRRLRNSSDHAAEREIWFTEHYAAFAAMVDIARAFHPATAGYINRVFHDTILEPSAPEPSQEIAAARILTNLVDFSAPELVGREEHIEDIRVFWNARYRRVLSIVGKGGVGKTALLDAFTESLLNSPCPQDSNPDPEMIVYLTAKDNYLPGMRSAPAAHRFRTLHRVAEVTLGLVGETISPADTAEETIAKVQALAEHNRILFCLDNLESLDNIEHRQIEQFLHDLPAPSKAIVTTRVDRSIGKPINLEGLSPPAAKQLLLHRLSQHQMEPAGSDLRAVDDLISYTGGSPLAIIAVANKVVNGGETVTEAVQSFKGKTGLELFEFAYESSISLLSHSALQALLFLASSKEPRNRKDMMPFVTDEQELDSVLKTLVDTCLVQYVREESRRILFSVNGDVRDYVLKRGPELLPPDLVALVRGRANMRPEQLQSASIRIEVDKAIQAAEECAFHQDWNRAISLIDQARNRWGDEPRLLEKLGYYSFRLRDRPRARSFLETAIGKGYESAECYAYLALLEFYDGHYGRGYQRAESALTLRPVYPFADQIAGECLVEEAFRSALTLSTDARAKLLQRAIAHLRRSLSSNPAGVNETEFTRRGRQYIQRAEQLHQDVETEARASLRGR